MALKKFYFRKVKLFDGSYEWILQLFPTFEDILFQDGTKAQTLKKAIKHVKKEGGSLLIFKLNGQFQEERTYPRSADPKSSKG